MQPPFAAGIDQPIAHQRLQDVLPAGALARVRQQRRKEPVQLQLLIEMTGEPARAPLARAMQLHRLKTHLHPISLRVFGNRAIGRKQSELPVPACPFIKGFDLTTPGLMLAVIDLAEIQHLALHHPAAGAALALDNVPIAMLFTVFETSVEAQKHANQFTPNQIDEKILGLHYRRFATAPL
jgi:hypothetical protein